MATAILPSAALVCSSTPASRVISITNSWVKGWGRDLLETLNPDFRENFWCELTIGVCAVLEKLQQCLFTESLFEGQKR